MPVHPKARAFGPAAPTYERGRPDYPPQIQDWLRQSVGLGPGVIVVDLGAGTGKFTPNLLATGARVVAVEPVDGMRSALAARLPEVETLTGSAAAIPLPSASVQAVVCAQAFHWFATDEAMAEIRRVLSPGGRLALVWNVRDERTPWVARLGAILDAHQGETPQHATGRWRDVFPAAGFGPLHESRFAHAHTGDPERVILDRVASVSYIADLSEPARAKVLEDVRRLIADEPKLAGRAIVDFPYETRAYWAQRI